MKLTPEIAEAIIRLEGNQDFKLVVEAMTTYRHEMVEWLLMGQTDMVHTYRGMARSQTEVLRALGSAREFLNTRSKGR